MVRDPRLHLRDIGPTGPTGSAWTSSRSRQACGLLWVSNATQEALGVSQGLTSLDQKVA